MIFEDKELKTLDDPNDPIYINEVFPDKLNIHSSEADSDSTSTGRLLKKTSGASVPATLSSRDMLVPRTQIPTKTATGSHRRHTYHCPWVSRCKARKNGISKITG
jgi:hypothetical protein